MIDTTPVKAISHSVVITLRRRTAATISSSPVTTAQIPITNTNPRATAAGWKNVSTPTASPRIPLSTSGHHWSCSPAANSPKPNSRMPSTKGEGSEKQDENVEGDAWPDKRGDSEDDREE